MYNVLEIRTYMHQIWNNLDFERDDRVGILKYGNKISIGLYEIGSYGKLYIHMYQIVFNLVQF